MKENVFGLPVNVRSREDAEAKAATEPTLYGCMRCNDLPRFRIPEPVRSRIQIGWCTKCTASVWIDPLSFVPGTFPTCGPCLPEELEAIALPETVQQVRELYPDAPFTFRDET